jgi:hypothetical protein
MNTNTIPSASPSWTLSRHVRAAIICNDLPVTAETASDEQIRKVAVNLLRYGYAEIEGWDNLTVRAILLDKAVTSPYPAEAPAKYAGK